MPGSRLLIAALAAFAGGWTLLDAAANGLAATQLPAPRTIDWLPFVALAVVGTVAGVFVRPRRTAAAVLALLCGSAGAGVVGADALRVGLLVLGVAAIVAANAHATATAGVGANWCAVGVAAVAGALAVACWPPARSVAGTFPSAMATVLTMVLAAASTGELPVPPVRRWSLGDASTAFAVAVLLWFAAPAALWSGAGGASVVLYAGLAGAAVWAWSGALRGGALLCACAAVIANASTPGRWAPSDPARCRVLAQGRFGVATYDRSDQTMSWWVDGACVAAAGPEHPAPELAATLVHCFTRPGDRVLVLGSGTGRLPDLLVRGGVHEVEVVVPGEPAAPSATLALDGPTPSPEPEAEAPGVRRRIGGWLSAVASLPAGSRAAVVVDGVPPVCGDRLPDHATQHALRAAVGDGIVLQPMSLAHDDPRRTRALLSAAAAVHPWNGVVAVGDAAWLVSAGATPRWPNGDVMARWGDEARWTAHAAHLGDAADVRGAFLGTVRSLLAGEPPPGDPASSGRAALVGVLHAMVEPVAGAEGEAERSLFRHWRSARAAVRAADAAIAALGSTPDDVARAQGIAARMLHVGAPSASLQAALGLPDASGTPLVSPEAAVLRAHAIDPTFFAAVPPVLAGLPHPPERGDLEDLARLPPDERLAELCSGASPFAVALRARFPSRCAKALIAALGKAPLSPASKDALRELADPFVLEQAGAVLRARRSLAELLAFWRADLPLPSVLEVAADDDPPLQRSVAAALAGRRDAGSTRMLARFLTDLAPEVRRIAGESLRTSYGARVPYDPEWPRSALIEAADRVRSLHNRSP